MRPLVLLDRDGVINHDAPRGIHHIDDFHFLPRALDAIAMLHDAGFAIAICTNQSAVGRGWISMQTVDAIHAHMREQVVQHGGAIDAIYVAPDAPDAATSRRKPAPGMLLEALAEFHAAPARTPFIGDALRDMQAAHAAGCVPICVRTGKGEATIAEGFDAGIGDVRRAVDLYDAAEQWHDFYTRQGW